MYNAYGGGGGYREWSTLQKNIALLYYEADRQKKGKFESDIWKKNI